MSSLPSALRRWGVAVTAVAGIAGLLAVASPSSASAGIRPTAPTRVLDTRTGIGAPTGRPVAGSVTRLHLSASLGVPTNAAAVALNLTATDVTGEGYVTVWPCGTPQPNASNLNVTTGTTIANLVIVKPGTDGTICLYTHTPAHLIADLNAWYPADADLRTTTPTRVLDTRTGTGTAFNRPTAGSITQLRLNAALGIPVGAAVALNVTATGVTGEGYVTVWPCGTPQPNASNLNVTTGTTIANLVIVKPGTDGTICLYTHTPAHLIADLNAWYPADADLRTTTPTRVLDTRTGTGAPATRPIGGSIVQLRLNPTLGIPATAAAVALNVTATGVTGEGYVTVWPCGTPQPNASNLNVTTGTTIANLVIVKPGTDGTICLYTHTPAHLITDLNAWFAGTPITSPSVAVTPGPAGAPSGNATATGDFPDNPGFDPAYPSAAVTVAYDGEAPTPPTQEEMAAALWATEDGDRDGGELEQAMYTGEPTFPIGQAGYAESVPAAVGRVVMWKQVNGTWVRSSSCTGTVAGPNMVLTAAHCLDGGWDAYSFIPGLYGSSMPHGEWVAAASRAYYPTQWNQLRENSWQVMFDYAFIKFDPQYNGGRNITDQIAPFPIYQAPTLAGADVYVVGYPAEGFYSSANGGYCAPVDILCYPYFCSSKIAKEVGGNGWTAIGYGCDANGGISGAAVFSKIGGTWYIVATHVQGGWLVDRSGNRCVDRGLCNWYMPNGWGPLFRAGFLDAMWHEVKAL